MTVALPPARAGHLVDWLIAAGPLARDAAGPRALDWRDIAAWAELTGHAPGAWEAATLRRLSAEYLGELLAAKDPARPAPFEDAATIEANRAAVERKLRAALTAHPR